MLKTFSSNSIKYIRSLIKNVPNKIYSVEIKIKSKPQNISQTPELCASKSSKELKLVNEPKLNENVLNIASSSHQTNELVNKETSSENVVTDKFILEDYYNYNEWKENSDQGSYSHSSDEIIKLIDSLELRSRSIQNISISTIISWNTMIKLLNKHLRTNSELISLSISQRIISSLLRIQQISSNLELKRYCLINESYLNHYTMLQENSRSVLAQLGYTNPPKGRGIRILSIDGGGTRGVVVIEILRQIEKAYGEPIHKIFDLICGVSTGAIISMLLGAMRITIDECETYYRQVSSYLFKTDIITGTGRLLWSHAYYDTTVWEKILKEIYGPDTVMADTKRKSDCPNILAISAIVNLHSLQPYLFRNYDLCAASKPFSHFEGGSQHKLWEAVRASAAAPGYFEEFTLGKHVHQDGGILINNPTAVAVHEAKLIWPNEKIQCVLSLGSGRYQPDQSFDNKNMPATPSSLKHKIARLIDSATDTEMIHRLMHDLLPSNTYFRLNPMLRYQANIDETRPERLESMKIDAKMYLRKNEHKFNQAIRNLKLERNLLQQLVDKVKYKTITFK